MSVSDKLAALRAKIAAQSAGTQTVSPTGRTVDVNPQPQKQEQPARQSILTQKSSLPFELLEKVSALEDALLDRHPRMPGLLAEIYKALKAQPENVTLMSEEEVRVIVESLKIQTGVQFMEKVTKSKSTNAKLKNATTEMF